MSMFSNRKQIFSQYKLPQLPQLKSQQFNRTKIKLDSNEILIKKLGLFKFNISAVLSERDDLVGKFNQFQTKINKVLRFITDYNQSQSTGSAENDRFFEMSEQMRGIKRMVEQSLIKPIQEMGRVSGSRVSQDRRDSSVWKDMDSSSLSDLQIGLISYRRLLNQGQALKYQAQTFRIGTLSNFNPSHTKANYTKSAAEASQCVQGYIGQIILKSSNALESKIRFRKGYEQNRFLTEEDKYEYCWKQVQQLLTSKKVQQINYQMLNILSEFDFILGKFSQKLQGHRQSYSKYQGVLESFKLMKRQIQQMDDIVRSRDHLMQTISAEQGQGIQKHYDFSAYQPVITRAMEDENIISKNLKIYHINQRIFAYYNSETNLGVFARRRNQYSQKLEQLQQRMDRWQSQCDVINTISKRYDQVYQLIRRRTYASEANDIKIGKQLQTTNDIDRQIAQIQAVSVKSDARLKKMKKMVVLQLINRMKRGGSEKIQNPVLSKQNLKEQQLQTLQKQWSFFKQITRRKDTQRKPFMVQNKSRINQYIIYNKKLISGGSPTNSKLAFHKYLEILKCEFQMCYLMVKIGQDMKRSDLIFEEAVNEHVDQLSLKIQQRNRLNSANQINPVIYSHYYSYYLVSNMFQSSQYKQLTSQISSLYSKPPKSINFTSQNPVKPFKQLLKCTDAFIKENYEKLIEDILLTYSQTLLKVPQTQIQLIQAFERQYWHKITQTVKTFYRRNEFQIQQNITSTKTVDKGVFFTIPMLIQITRKVMKIINLDEIVLKIAQMIQNKIQSCSNHQKLNKIICLTLILEYFDKQWQFVKHKNIYVLMKLRRLLTCQIIKTQFIHKYEQQLKHQTDRKAQNITILLSLQRYIRCDSLQLKQLAIINQDPKYINQVQRRLKYIQKEISPIVLIVPRERGDVLSLSIFEILYTFQAWPSQLYALISQKQVSSPNLSSFILSFCSSIWHRNQTLQFLINANPKQNDFSQTQGFLTKIQQKQNFYIKKQIKLYRLLLKDNLWVSFIKVLRQVKEKAIQNSVWRSVGIEDMKQSLRNIDTKVKNTIRINNI